ncbi:hypothetical protein CBW65_04390 [Tumebacillus avium]|uniref:Nucleotidyltransferase n=1 Tax=Tumebacillus avium TaxID=1903704 RepID=A0A1Y0IJX0_9BACL|nr:nucleotidyltransferase family protein [Tumebacillus avium]ARU60389.1 hypothetical protein CBW65_04390 [Tumebacillus avium]
MDTIREFILHSCKITYTKHDVEQACNLLPNISFDDLFPRLRKIKTIYVFYKFLQEMRKTAPAALHDKIDEFLNALDEKHRGEQAVLAKKQLMESSFREVVALATSLGVPVLAVKGCCMPFLLPDYRLREQNDIDIVVPDLPHMWKLAAGLSSLGHRVAEDESPWLQFFEHEGSTVIGAHLTLIREIDIDIHTHSMTFAQAEILQTPIWQRARLVELEDAGHFYLPTPEDTFLFALAHTYNHGYFTIKDLNDAYMLLSQYQNEFDWDYVLEQAQRNCLEKGLADLARYLSDYYQYQIGVALSTQPQGLQLIALDEVDDYFFYHHELDLAKQRNDLQRGLLMIAKRQEILNRMLVLADESKEAEHELLQEQLEGRHLCEGLQLGDPILFTEVGKFEGANESAPQPFPAYDWWKQFDQHILQIAEDTYVLPTQANGELLITPSGYYSTSKTMIFTEVQFEALEAKVLEIHAALLTHQSTGEDV